MFRLSTQLKKFTSNAQKIVQKTYIQKDLENPSLESRSDGLKALTESRKNQWEVMESLPLGPKGDHRSVESRNSSFSSLSKCLLPVWAEREVLIT